jgi:phosphatidylserine decarboxylase
MDMTEGTSPNERYRTRRTLILQIVLVVICLGSLASWAICFPYPSPLIKPLLSPRLRWPQSQITSWIEQGTVGADYLHFFNRDPDRHPPPGDNLVSPSDGILQALAFQDGITYVVVGLSFWDVHVVRSPVSGVVTDIEPEGYYFTRNASKRDLRDAIFLRGKTAPVQEIVSLSTVHGPVRVRLITSYWASRLKIWVHVGQHLAKGERIGRILLGSTVVAELPGHAQLTVREQQRVVGGETVICWGDKS